MDNVCGHGIVYRIHKYMKNKKIELPHAKHEEGNESSKTWMKKKPTQNAWGGRPIICHS